MSGTKADGRLVRGEQTRRAILDRAVDIATVEGLEGLSIGRLAGELGASKSGVFAHFGSKEELQLAAVERAAEIFKDRVVRPAMKAPFGVRRVWKLSDAWLDYQRATFTGGCFFAAASTEFDGRPGRVRDAIAGYKRDWARHYEQAIHDAQQLGEIDPGIDPQQLAFELDAFVAAANAAARLYDDLSAYRRARRATLDRLRAVATDPSLLPARPD